jgi:hypothetical protein
MNVRGFLCVSVGSSTVQLHDSLGNRGPCACSVAGFIIQNGVLGEHSTEEHRCVVCFCEQKDSMQRIFIKNFFFFTVGSVCRVKLFTTGS